MATAVAAAAAAAAATTTGTNPSQHGFQPIPRPVSSSGSVNLWIRVVHQSVETVGKEFYEYLRRRVWVTPMSYLELLGSFKRQLTKKREEVGRNRSRLQVCFAWDPPSHPGPMHTAFVKPNTFRRVDRGCVLVLSNAGSVFALKESLVCRTYSTQRRTQALC